MSVLLCESESWTERRNKEEKSKRRKYTSSERGYGITFQNRNGDVGEELQKSEICTEKLYQ
jgi:hypothetical protein